MKPKDLITKVQKVADTSPKHSHVTASDVSRVISETFAVLAKLPASEYSETISALTKLGAKKNEAAKASKKKK